MDTYHYVPIKNHPTTSSYLRISLEQQHNGAWQARVIESLPVIDLDAVAEMNAGLREDVGGHHHGDAKEPRP